MENILLALMLVGTVGAGVAAWFLYVWGWGDAAWGDKDLHPGHPQDAWHKKRRKAFYAVAVMAAWANPILLAVLIWQGRRLFRMGVKNASEEVYRRWYGDL